MLHCRRIHLDWKTAINSSSKKHGIKNRKELIGMFAIKRNRRIDFLSLVKAINPQLYPKIGDFVPPFLFVKYRNPVVG